MKVCFKTESFKTALEALEVKKKRKVKAKVDVLEVGGGHTAQGL